MASQIDYQVLLETIITTAKKAADKNRGKIDVESKAKLFAYCDVLDAVMTQADILEVPLADIGLDGFDPYDLGEGKKAA